jgi:small subunit ribosomal protein S9
MLISGEGRMRINGRTLEDYFPRPTHRIIIMKPLELTKTKDIYDIKANVSGGGSTGQAEAIKHGLARALVLADNSFKDILKKNGFLTRDSRMKERKKYGRKRARRRFQYSKR